MLALLTLADLALTLLPLLAGLLLALLASRLLIVFARHLPGEFLGLLPKLRLIARQLLQRALLFFVAHLRAIAREILLALQEIVLPAGEAP